MTNTTTEDDTVERCPNVGCGSAVDSDVSTQPPPAQRTRRESLYKLKNIEAPTVTRGNSISKRTENLFKSYERDISVHEAKPMANVNEESEIDVNGFRSLDHDNDEDKENKTKIEYAREEKERELLCIKRQYQQRLVEEEKQQRTQRDRRRSEYSQTQTYITTFIVSSTHLWLISILLCPSVSQ